MDVRDKLSLTSLHLFFVMTPINNLYQGWFDQVSPTQICSYVKSKRFKAKIPKALDDTPTYLCSVLKKTMNNGYYAGEIVGDRVQKIAIAENNIIDWVKDFELSSSINPYNKDTLSVRFLTSKKDRYGNDKKSFIIDFDKHYAFSIDKKLTGRIFVEIIPILKSRIVLSKMRQWIARRFPQFVNPLNDKFESYFDVTARVWSDAIHYSDITCCTIPISENILIPLEEKTNERYEYTKRSQIFSSGGVLSKC